MEKKTSYRVDFKNKAKERVSFDFYIEKDAREFFARKREEFGNAKLIEITILEEILMEAR
jgi:hypothetical protein